jgi:hypothetical protein
MKRSIRTPRSSEARWQVAVVVAVALVAAIGAIGLARDEKPADALVLDACATSPAVTTAASAGFDCTLLFSRTNPTQVVGQLFAKLEAGTVTLASDLFDPRRDTGFAGAKLCIDDDPDPRANRVSCTVSTAGSAVNKAYTIGTGPKQVKPAAVGDGPDRYEEAAGRYEYLIEGLGLGLGVPPLAGLTAYTALVGTVASSYDEFSFHFNQGSSSIEAFFELEPEGILVPCDTDTTFDGATTDPTLTVRIEGGCTNKRLLFDAGTRSDADATQFVELRPARPSETLMLFLEEIEWAPIAGGAPLAQLQYDDIYPDAASVATEPMQTCLQDPRVPGAFDIRDDISVATAATVLPAEQTSCLVDFDMSYAGSDIDVVHIVFNVGDGMRTYR